MHFAQVHLVYIYLSFTHNLGSRNILKNKMLKSEICRWNLYFGHLRAFDNLKFDELNQFVIFIKFLSKFACVQVIRPCACTANKIKCSVVMAAVGWHRLGYCVNVFWAHQLRLLNNLLLVATQLVYFFLCWMDCPSRDGMCWATEQRTMKCYTDIFYFATKPCLF